MIVSLLLLCKSALINNSPCTVYKDSLYFFIRTYNFTKIIQKKEILISILGVLMS